MDWHDPSHPHRIVSDGELASRQIRISTLELDEIDQAFAAWSRERFPSGCSRIDVGDMPLVLINDNSGALIDAFLRNNSPVSRHRGTLDDTSVDLLRDYESKLEAILPDLPSHAHEYFGELRRIILMVLERLARKV